MKTQTHILIALLALVISACASQEPLTKAELEQQEEQREFTQNEFEASSRFR